MSQSRNIPVLQALLAAVLFGSSTPISKLLLSDVDPVPLAGILYLGSGIGAALLLLFKKFDPVSKKKEANLSLTDIPWMIGAVFAGGVAAPIILLFSLQVTPAASASLLLNFESVATTIIAMIVFKEAVDKRILMAMISITLASILLSWDGNNNWGLSIGALGILGACFFWGMDNNFTRKISAKNPLSLVAIKGIGAGSFSLILALILRKPLPGIEIILLAALIGFVCYGISIALFIRAMRSLGASRTSTLFGAAPFVGMSLSIVIFNMVPNGLFWATIPLLLAGMYLMFSEQHDHTHKHEPDEHEHCHMHPDSHHIHEHENEVAFEGEHSHWHMHEELEHCHSHTPDIHHWHDHPAET